MAATTERRKSFSQFFGFSKAEPKQESAPEYPKLRRKLQKVTKQTDAGIDHAPSGHVTSPAPDSIETVKVPGDDSFLSTKYESRPVSSYGGADKVPTAAEAKPGKEDKRSRRESRTRFFSRSSSTSRAPNASRSASCNRASSIASRPGSSRVENRPQTSAAVPPIPSGILTTKDLPACAPTAPAAPASNSTNEATREKEDKAAQTAKHTRALEILEAHERAAAQEWAGKNRGSLSFGPAEPAKTRPRTPRKQELTPPPSRGQIQADERPLTRPFTQFHLPYKHTPNNSIASAQKIDDAIEARFYANRSPYPARQFVPAPMTLPIKRSTHGPFTPSHSHSNSNASSASIATPVSATFSTCLSFTSASSVNPSCNTLSYSAPSVASSCVGSPDDVRSGPFGFSREHGRQHSQESNGDNRVVPELSYLSRGRGHTQHYPESPASVTSDESSSATKPRRKKTPVYAIGQLEGSSSSDEASSNESEHVSKQDHVALNVQTPPDSPVFSATALDVDNGHAELSLLKSKSSIECIAEEYRALLASRDSQHSRNSDKNARYQTPPLAKTPAPRKFLLSPAAEQHAPQVVHTDSYWDLRAMPGAMPVSPPPMTKMTPPLPLRTRSSMYGTNPVSKTPVSANNKPAPKPKMAQPQPQPQPDNLSLQICVDLLARELSSAVTHRSSAAAATAASQRAATRRSLQHSMAGGIRDPRTLTLPKSTPSMAPPASDSAGSALQILVMIEAYERLRDQLVADARRKRRHSSMGRGGRNDATSDGEVEQIEAMFGMWLKSLYQIHDSLTCSSDEDGSDGLDNTSESEYEST